MRPSARLGLVLVAFFAFEVIIPKMAPPGFIQSPYSAPVGKCGIVTSLFLVPAVFILIPPQAIRACKVRERALYTVLVAWFLQVQFWAAFVAPVNSQLKFQKGDAADGFVSNYGIHLPAFMSSLFLTLICVAVRPRARRQNTEKD